MCSGSWFSSKLPSATWPEYGRRRRSPRPPWAAMPHPDSGQYRHVYTSCTCRRSSPSLAASRPSAGRRPVDRRLARCWGCDGFHRRRPTRRRPAACYDYTVHRPLIQCHSRCRRRDACHSRQKAQGTIGPVPRKPKVRPISFGWWIRGKEGSMKWTRTLSL